MQKFIYIAFFFWIGNSFGIAQNDSIAIKTLQNQLLSEKNENKKINIALEIADKLQYNSTTEVEKYANVALSLAKKQNQFQSQVKANQFLGNCAIITGNYKKAFFYFDNSKKIYENQLQNDYSGIIKTYGSLGIIASEQSNYNKALEYYLQGKHIAEKHKLIPLQIILNNNIGVIYKSTKRYKEALTILEQTQKLQKQTNDVNRGITLTNIATIYEQLKDTVSQKKYLDVAFSELKKGNDYRALGEWYNNIGNYYFVKNNPIEAEKNWNLALQNFDKIQDKFGSFDTYYYLSQVKQKQNQTGLALQFAEKAKILAYETQVLEHQSKIEKQLSILLEQQNLFSKALFHAKNHQKLQDSLINQETIRKTAELEMNFEFEKEKIKHQEALQQAKNKQWFWALALIILALLFGLWYLNKKKIQQKKQLALENQILEYKQKALHLQMNPHFIFNCLAAISSYIMQNEKEEAMKYVAMFSKLMRFTLESSKENLITVDKEITSLNQYLKLEQLRLKSVFDFSITKDATVEDDLLLPPMLIQPLVENAIIHGILPKQAKGTISIHFSTTKDHITIEVNDNGIGIEKSKEQKKNQVKLHKSLALSIIKERLEMIEKTSMQMANIEYKQTDYGTNVVMILPLRYSL